MNKTSMELINERINLYIRPKYWIMTGAGRQLSYKEYKIDISSLYVDRASTGFLDYEQ